MASPGDRAQQRKAEIDSRRIYAEPTVAPQDASRNVASGLTGEANWRATFGPKEQPGLGQWGKGIVTSSPTGAEDTGAAEGQRIAGEFTTPGAAPARVSAYSNPVVNTAFNPAPFSTPNFGLGFGQHSPFLAEQKTSQIANSAPASNLGAAPPPRLSAYGKVGTEPEAKPDSTQPGILDYAARAGSYLNSGMRAFPNALVQSQMPALRFLKGLFTGG